MVFPDNYLQELRVAVQEVKPQRALIFGSGVKKGLDARDLDLLIISDLFGRYLWQNRSGLLRLPEGPIYDLRLFTPKEFDIFFPNSSPLRKNIENQHIDLRECYA